MGLEDDLLAVARFLVRSEPRRPKQATLRRAISTAYYALFHLLVREATWMLIPGQRQTVLRARASRAFSHSDMKKACRAFAAGGFPPHMVPFLPAGSVLRDLQIVADAFVELQETRHDADYDVAERFTKNEAAELVDLADNAFQCWRRIRTSPDAKVFLASLLLWEAWRR